MPFTPGAAVTFLLDGYNLMHAVGSAPAAGSSRGMFDAARKRFLDWLADSPAVRSGSHSVRVVFDAQNSTRDFGSSTHRGLIVTYSFRETADDLIEALVSVDANPQALRVVSNDTRVRDFARRHQCKTLSCEKFVDWLLDPPPDPADTVRGGGRDDKPPPIPADEFDMLMKAFQVKKPR